LIICTTYTIGLIGIKHTYEITAIV